MSIHTKGFFTLAAASALETAVCVQQVAAGHVQVGAVSGGVAAFVALIALREAAGEIACRLVVPKLRNIPALPQEAPGLSG